MPDDLTNPLSKPGEHADLDRGPTKVRSPEVTEHVKEKRWGGKMRSICWTCWPASK
jgi:hypothetical protein